nr:immunoglobulin light chain junction region [Macaca mulatta]MOW08521.1 immunoglobulin light chain junction region [Macaca mulatta]MOW08823.1 immunoglobulin light chain junction region [Macaca mulatta]MOW09521.1 immunoglobulin light chain junction region [Macaca mulatta]MOW10188.1 immunoglobulin light chain junction region [Macaca mulatta]
CQKYSASPFTF